MKRIIVLSFLIFGISLQAMQQPQNIIEAVIAGNLELVKKILDQGADLNQTNSSDNTLLHLAALNGHLPIAQLLLDRGAAVNQTNILRRTPLHLAADWGHLHLVQLLLDRGAAINQTDGGGKNALMWAVLGNDEVCCELLINHLMKIPSKAQTKHICTFLLCMKQLNMPRDLAKYILPKHLLAVIEAENREKPDGSVALREINKIKDEDTKKALIAKFWPHRP